MRVFKVGELYNPQIKRWPETPQYNFRSGGHELVLFYTNPTAEEVESVRAGAAEFAFHYERDVVFFLYRFGSQPWSDAPYSWWLLPEAERVLPAVDESAGARAVLNVILVDAGNGIIKVLRALTLATRFTLELHRAITRQVQSTWRRSVYDGNLSYLYGKYPTSEALLKVAIAKTKGGA